MLCMSARAYICYIGLHTTWVCVHVLFAKYYGVFCAGSSSSHNVCEMCTLAWHIVVYYLYLVYLPRAMKICLSTNARARAREEICMLNKANADEGTSISLCVRSDQWVFSRVDFFFHISSTAYRLKILCRILYV